MICFYDTSLTPKIPMNKSMILSLIEETKDHHEVCSCVKCIALDSLDYEESKFMSSQVTFETAKLGSWWRHDPSGTIYQLRRLPQSMDKVSIRNSGKCLWHRDKKIALHFPIETPSDFTFLGYGHDPELATIPIEE